jgi:translocation and assembly module TamA
MRFTYYLLLFTFLSISSTSTPLSAIVPYEVKFEGMFSPETLALLQSTSQLATLKKSPPNTSAGLRHRAEADIPNLLKILHSEAYYNATVELDYNFETSPAIVTFFVIPGPVYPFAAFNIVALPLENDPEKESTELVRHCTEEASPPLSPISPTPSTPPTSPIPSAAPTPPTPPGYPVESIRLKHLGITLGRPALPKNILEAEELLLLYLARKGYPLATIKKREVVADQATHAITVTLTVDSGPLTYFGSTKISGQKSIRNEFFQKKISWRQKGIYDPSQVEETQQGLEASGLFSSINVTHGDEPTSESELPMFIEVVESKHRSIGFGVSYTTIWGAGVNFEWEHRNIRGLGEKLSFVSDIRQLLQETSLLYVKPDFIRPGQDLLLLSELQHETTKGFTEFSYSASASIERQLDKRTRFSYGIMYKRLRDTHAVNNGLYNLIKTPFHLRWSDANNLLDPTRGTTISLRVIPSLQFLDKPFWYCINMGTVSHYVPLTQNKKYVLAFRAAVGSILGSSRRTIPASERLYEGTENSLRGYRYLTVSPLSDDHKPIGGRSLLSFTSELRVRATENFGWVAFHDMGNVYESVMPQLGRKVYHSVGCGIRYFTPVGPLRVDLAFPLSPRSHLDHRFQIYFSIGQAF